MRISVKISGVGDKFVGEVSVDRTFCQKGLNNPVSNFFGTSLANSISNALRRMEEELRASAGDAEIDRIRTNLANGNFSFVHADVWHESRKGRNLNFCRISIDEASGKVRTKNVLPWAGRVIWMWAWLLVRCTPPKGFEELRQLQLIKAFEDKMDATHRPMLHLDESSGKYEVVDVAREEFEKIKKEK